MKQREVRIRQVLDRWDSAARTYAKVPQPVVLVDSKAWVMVRRADAAGAAPFVISLKEWESLPRE